MYGTRPGGVGLPRGLRVSSLPQPGTWLLHRSPGHPERAEAGLLAGAPSSPGLAGVRAGVWPPPPTPSHGWRLGVQLRAEGGWALRAPGRALKQQEPQSECQFGSSETPSPLHPCWALASAWRCLGPKSWGPRPAKCLQGAGGAAPAQGPAEPYPDSREEPRREGRPGGAWGGVLGTCAHVCTHVHAYRHTHVHTHVRRAVRGHTRMHTTNARGPRDVAVMVRGPRRRSGREAAGRARGAQQSTGTPSVEKIMPVVGS